MDVNSHIGTLRCLLIIYTVLFAWSLITGTTNKTDLKT